MALGQGALKGKKTYILAALGILGAIAGYLTGDLTLGDALRVAQDSGLFAALRAALPS